MCACNARAVLRVYFWNTVLLDEPEIWLHEDELWGIGICNFNDMDKDGTGFWGSRLEKGCVLLYNVKKFLLSSRRYRMEKSILNCKNWMRVITVRMPTWTTIVSLFCEFTDSMTYAHCGRPARHHVSLSRRRWKTAFAASASICTQKRTLRYRLLRPSRPQASQTGSSFCRGYGSDAVRR